MRPSERIDELAREILKKEMVHGTPTDNAMSGARFRALIKYLDEQYESIGGNAGV